MTSPWDRVSQAMQRKAALVSDAAVQSYGKMGELAYRGISQGLGGAIPAYQDARLRQGQIEGQETSNQFLQGDLEQRAKRGALQIAREQKELDNFDAKLMRESALYDLEIKMGQSRLVGAEAELAETNARVARLQIEKQMMEQRAQAEGQMTEFELRNTITFDKHGRPIGVVGGDLQSGFETGALEPDDPRVLMHMARVNGGGRRAAAPGLDPTKMHADIKAELDALENADLTDEERDAKRRRLLEQYRQRVGLGGDSQLTGAANDAIRRQSEQVLDSLFRGAEAPAAEAGEPADPWSTEAFYPDIDRYVAGGSHNRTSWETARQMTGLSPQAFRAKVAEAMRQGHGPGKPRPEWFNEEIEQLLMEIALSPQEFRESR